MSGPVCDVTAPVPCPCEPVPTIAPQPPDPPAPVVTVRVRVPGCAKAGEEVEYRILVENCSSAAAHHVLIRNPLPANARFVRASPEPHRRAPELQWDLGTMQGGARCEIVLVLRATSGADLTNCTRVQFEHGECVTTRIAGSAPVAPKGPSTKEPSTKEPPSIPGGKAKLGLTMSGPEQQFINIPAQYFITVKNVGTAPATNVLIADKLPDGTTFVRADQNGQFAEGQVAWIVGTLEAGTSKTVELVLRAKGAGKICNKARVEADGGLKAEAEACTIFKGASALLLEMVDRKDPIPVGGDTSYPIMVLNQGHLPVKNIRIKAFISPAMKLVKADGPTKYQVGSKTPDGYQVLIFEPLPGLEVGAKVEYEVYVQAVRPADARFKIEMSADYQEAGPVRQEESTTIFPENGNAPRRPGLETRLRRAK